MGVTASTGTTIVQAGLVGSNKRYRRRCKVLSFQALLLVA